MEELTGGVRMTGSGTGGAVGQRGQPQAEGTCASTMMLKTALPWNHWGKTHVTGAETVGGYGEVGGGGSGIQTSGAGEGSRSRTGRGT